MPDFDISQFQPASLTVEDMVGCRITYFHDNAMGYPPRIETGVIVAVKQVNNVLWMLVQPDNPCLMARWRDEWKFIAYCHSAEKITAA